MHFLVMVNSIGYSINDSGQVVGESNMKAFVTDGGIMQDLNSLLDGSGAGWELYFARGINDSGQITGLGSHNGLGHAFLLTPVPTPAAFWMIGSGLLGLMRVKARKRVMA